MSSILYIILALSFSTFITGTPVTELEPIVIPDENGFLWPGPHLSYDFVSASEQFDLSKNDIDENAVPSIAVKKGTTEANEDRILHGTAVTSNKYPFVVSVQELKKNGKISKFCGGSILNNRWIITAAHCFIGFRNVSEHDIRINAGSLNAFQYKEPSQFMKVIRIIIYPTFGKTGNREDDIALLLLHQPLQFNAHVQPIKLPPLGLVTPIASTGIIMGWGTVDTTEVIPSHELREANITVFENKKCQQHFTSKLTSRQLCLGLFNPTNACAGDSGGPFIQFINNHPVLLGVTSYGATGCYEDKPIIYTRVAAYVESIEKTIQKFTNKV